MAAFDTHFLAWFDRLELNVIGPTRTLSQTTTKLCASSLKVGEHFAYRPKVSAESLRTVKDKFKAVVKALPAVRCAELIKKSTLCAYKMYENSARLLRELHHAKRIKSEAALRYTVGDPLMEMLCDSGRLKVQLEESVKSNKDEPAVSQPTTPKNRAKVVTPSTLATKVADATSGGSRADYTCYTLRDSDDQILAVVLETKMDHSSQDAVAQVMGYVAAFKKGDLIPPAALVVTETLVDILLFPFIHDDNRLLTAAQISVKLWQEEVPLVEPKCLLLVACLAFVEFKLFTIEQPTAKPYEQMRKIVAIATESEEKDEYVAKLEAQLSEKEKENEKEKVHNEKEKAQLSAELRKLEARNRKLEAQLRELRN